MERLTERTPAGDVAYTGRHTRLPGLEDASTMTVAARRDVLRRLAAYEDTGLTPSEIDALASMALRMAVEAARATA